MKFMSHILKWVCALCCIYNVLPSGLFLPVDCHGELEKTCSGNVELDVQIRDICEQASKEFPRAYTASITDYGAVGDGKTLNTHAFQNAINNLRSFANRGGLILRIPRGTWLTGSFNLTSHLTLYLDEGAVILGSQDPKEWPLIAPLPSYGRGRELPGPRHISLIHGEDLVDVVITGQNGTVDGQGSLWWQRFRNKTLDYTRGHLLELINSTAIVVKNITFLNSPFWNIHPVYCRDVFIQGVTILAPLNAPNTDGVDPDSSSNVCIQDCYIRNGDDAIAIKSGWDQYGIAFGRPSSNIVIQRVIGETTSSAGLALGSEISGGIHDVFVEDLTVVNSASGINVKTAVGRGGYVTNVTIANVQLDNVKYAVWFNSNFGDHPDNNYDQHAFSLVDEINIKDVSGKDIIHAGNMVGFMEAPFKGISLQHIHLNVHGGGFMWKCSSIQGFSSEVVPLPCPQLQGSLNQAVSQVS
ncbi:hypothetical protein O6H91_04G051800 [Diphasiastrum complanatum]|uniref:Uncharacterized protein n=9 Tax=Diphasiastrum complanatum TaxID=34168 RepID=A0ACC2DX70_DIPCM|nr:hypothetical protein O6H91_04G050400 [Diphasiastrum complanatum]KAJ7558661.1 hypothetical protein O6H91_04G050400 [Diphasiastrum complanatum]KAJ7558662.1 hypothetical protein O6H91_04G050400 [Diphasiastrum complanatum]KAJ7558663.1 hypothetical protein O6H91_04G050400 [Diphasiastrum complanatum]KAJ7558664.1 hypothetical protein O6H91_04G050400 [Diphasiastrum complanatum]